MRNASRPLVLLGGLAVAGGAAADIVRLGDGQVIAGTIQSCQAGEIVVAAPAAAPVRVKIADVVSGEGSGIERCLAGRTGVAGTRRWYGWEIIVAEAASVIAVPIGAGIGAPGIAGIGLVGAILSPAILHGVHGNPGKGAASIGIHVGMGLAGILLGAVLVPDNPNDDVVNLAGPALGLFLSQVIATTIDVASLAYEDPAPDVVVGVLFREPALQRLGRRAAPASLSLTVRF